MPNHSRHKSIFSRISARRKNSSRQFLAKSTTPGFLALFRSFKYYCLAEFPGGADYSRLDQQKFILRNFNFMTRKNDLQSVAKHKRGEAEWNREVNELRQTTLRLWHDLLTLESYYCLEIQDRVDFFEEVRRFETRIIKRALLHAGGSQRKTARLLGINTSTLNSKIKRYRIPVKPVLHKLTLADS
jgi:DNA-binding protein Fis